MGRRQYHEDCYDYLVAQIQSGHNETNETVPLQVESVHDISTPMCSDNRLDIFQFEDLHTLTFWMEGVCQFTVGSIGIISNLLAIPILSSPGMNSIFNKLLICLLILHTIYISSVILTESMWPVWKDDPHNSFDAWVFILFSFVLHPLKQLMRYSSTFITVLMARQQYLAIRHPIEYRNMNISTNLWIPAIKSLMFVLVAAGLFTFPIFLETRVEYNELGKIYDVNSTHFQYVSPLLSRIIIKNII